MCVHGSGNWNNASAAGVFNRNWNNNRSNANNNSGFRASVPDSVSILTSRNGNTGNKGSILSGQLGEIRKAGRLSIPSGRKSAHA